MKYDRIKGYKPGRESGELAKALSGRIHVTVFFVSQISDRWKAEAVTEEKKKLAEGEKWLVSQAARYGKTVSFVNSYFGDENDNPLLVKDFQSISSAAYDEYKDMLKIQKKRNLDNWGTYRRFVTEEMGCEHGIIIFIYSKPDTSYAAHSMSGYMFSSAVCHRNDRPGTYAHEILHLFGAWDMYKRSYDKGEARQQKCRLYFRDSIMHQSYNMWNQKIDEINAWLVGLKEEEKSWYNLFFPGWEEKEEQISSLVLYRDWRTGEYSDKPVPPKPTPPKPVTVRKKKSPPLNIWDKTKAWADKLPRKTFLLLNFFGVLVAGMAVSPVVMLIGLDYNWKWALAIVTYFAFILATCLGPDDI